MTAITELQNELEKYARTFKTFEQGAKALQLLAGLEQNEAELIKRVDVLKATENEWIAKKNKAVSDAEDAAKRAVENVSAAAEDVKRLLDEGRAQAAKVLGDAKNTAAKMVEEAKSAVEKHAAESEELAGKNSEVSKVLEASKAELAKVEGALAEHKASLQKFIGGGK